MRPLLKSRALRNLRTRVRKYRVLHAPSTVRWHAQGEAGALSRFPGIAAGVKNVPTTSYCKVPPHTGNQEWPMQLATSVRYRTKRQVKAGADLRSAGRKIFDESSSDKPARHRPMGDADGAVYSEFTSTALH
jgi:hypothetical protein